jgi:hypothetical protein
VEKIGKLQHLLLLSKTITMTQFLKIASLIAEKGGVFDEHRHTRNDGSRKTPNYGIALG